MTTLAEQFVQRFLAIPPVETKGKNEAFAVSEASRHHEAFLALYQELGAKHLNQRCGPNPIDVFPDRSGVLMQRDFERGDRYGIPRTFQRKYVALSEFEIERLLWEQRDLQGSLFRGQLPITDDSLWALRPYTYREFMEAARAPEFTYLMPGMSAFTIHGHARHLLQCSAWVDARTHDEVAEDKAELVRRAALTEAERDQEDLGGLLEGDLPRWKARLQNTSKKTRALQEGPRTVLREGRWIEVRFWLAYVRVTREEFTSDQHEETRLYFAHPHLGYGTSYNVMLGHLAQLTRERLEGKNPRMPHDYRDWFAGRGRQIDPLGDGDIG